MSVGEAELLYLVYFRAFNINYAIYIQVVVQSAALLFIESIKLKVCCYSLLLKFHIKYELMFLMVIKFKVIIYFSWLVLFGFLCYACVNYIAFYRVVRKLRLDLYFWNI